MSECDNNKVHISSNFLLSICLLIMLYTLLLVPFGGEIGGTMKHGRPEHKWDDNKGLAGCRKWGKEL